jgi:hypothetical protein
MDVPNHPSAAELSRYLARDARDTHRSPPTPRLSSRWHQSLPTYTPDEFQQVLRAAQGNTFVRTLSLQFPVTDRIVALLGEEDSSASGDDDDDDDDAEADADASAREAEAVAVDRLATLIGSFRRDKVTDLLIWERNDLPIPSGVVDKMLDGFSQGNAATRGLRWLALSCCPTVPALHRFLERFPGFSSDTSGGRAN